MLQLTSLYMSLCAHTRVSLSQWFWECGPWTSDISITWVPVGNADSQAPPQTYGVRHPRAEPSGLCCNKPSKRCWCLLKFENNCSRFYSRSTSSDLLDAARFFSKGWKFPLILASPWCHSDDLCLLCGRAGHCSLLSCPLPALEVPLTTSHFLSALRSRQVDSFGNTQTFTCGSFSSQEHQYVYLHMSPLDQSGHQYVYLHMSPLDQSGVSYVSNNNGLSAGCVSSQSPKSCFWSHDHI